ncbi:UDP-N-acetylmuramate dehydrogenase [Aquimarina spongiae]|uniref:UDP-N-acetylenolpyruvoylglucosamine reductase n=1 Tax=Aquimarina spongiae TaxID=570521 RepID=A0A1M6HJ55_9FLAO|nr:UDP-N-acetylmuramate dehydrogenase [Aquimarina spongiae]SHJ22227.1 UDP-N-acetylmuramate dehydrogenase [Aquimarina spongiae]
MKIEQRKSLKKYNTFGIEVFAREYIEISSESILKEALQVYKDKTLFILSGGSNMLLTKDIEATILHLTLKGIETEELSDEYVCVTANAGENWHEFVQYCIQQGYSGLENLSLIPGNVGSAPIQNIGAYGVELKDTMINCEAFEIATGEKYTFSNEDCKFGYRDSIFKNVVKGKYVISKVSFRLRKKNHVLNTSYGAIEAALSAQNIQDPTIKDVADAVIQIRKSKLPDPSEIGNSGSFFKNPVVSKSQYLNLLDRFPEIPSYTIDEDHIKIPAGWLIEQAGFKGKRWGDAGVHNKQALVLVNYGNATGQEILNVSREIQKEITEKFNINLETEVNII